MAHKMGTSEELRAAKAKKSRAAKNKEEQGPRRDPWVSQELLSVTKQVCVAHWGWKSECER